MWDNKPLDTRFIIPSINEIDDCLHFPYIGLVFYSKFEDKYYKVTSLASGYRINREGTIVRGNFLDNNTSAIEIKGYFVGNYEEFNSGTDPSNYYTKSEVDALIQGLQDQIDALTP